MADPENPIDDLTEDEEVEPMDWQKPIVSFLRNPQSKSTRKIRRKAVNYLLIGDELYKKSFEDDLLLKCFDHREAIKVMAEVHEGICGAH